jgi:hypothetical protein
MASRPGASLGSVEYGTRWRQGMGVDDEARVQAWWDRLSESDRDRLKQAVRQYPVDPSIVDLLLAAGEPMSSSWTATAIAGGEPAVTLRGPVEAFIETQLDDESPLY